MITELKAQLKEAQEKTIKFHEEVQEKTKTLQDRVDTIQDRCAWEHERRLSLEADVEKYRNMALIARGARPRSGWDIISE